MLLAVWEEVGGRMKSELDSFTLGEMIRRATGGASSSPEATATSIDQDVAGPAVAGTADQPDRENSVVGA